MIKIGKRGLLDMIAGSHVRKSDAHDRGRYSQINLLRLLMTINNILGAEQLKVMFTVPLRKV